MLNEYQVRELIQQMNNSERDFENFIHDTLMAIKQLTGITAITLMLYDVQLKRLRMIETIAHNGQQQIARYEQALLLDDINRPMGITDWVYHQNEPVCVMNVHTDPLWSSMYIETDPNIISELDLPLRNGNATIGVLCFESDVEGYLTNDAIDQIMPICDTFALKIEVVRAYHKQAKLKDGFLQIANISHILFDESLAMDLLLEKIMEVAMHLTGTRMGNILRYDETDGVLYIEVCHGAEVPKGYFQHVSEDDGVVGWCAAHRQIKNVPDVRHRTDGNYREIIPNMYSELAVPIINRDKLLGVINLESDRLSNFDETDEQLMRVFAEQIGMALQHREQEKRLELARIRDETLERLQNFVNASNKLPDVLKLIVESAQSLTASDYCSVHLYENDQMKRIFDSDGVHNNPEREQTHGKASSGKGLVKYMVEKIQADPQSNRLYNTGNAQQDEYYVGSVDMNSNMIYVATRHDGEIVCLLNVESKKPNAYGLEEEKTLQKLGDFAVLAINHARDANRLTLLNQASDELIKINTIDNINEAYRIIIDIADKNIAGIQTVIRRKEGRYNLVPISQHASLDKPTNPPRIMRVDEYPNKEAISNKNVYHIPDTHETNVLQSNPRFRTVMVVPLIWDDLYGTITFAKERPHSLDDGDAQFLYGLARLLAQTIHRLDQAQVQQSLDIFNKIAPSWGMQVHTVKGNVSLAYQQLKALVENDWGSDKQHKILHILEEARADLIALCGTFETWDNHASELVNIRDVWRDCVKKLQSQLHDAHLDASECNYPTHHDDFIYANKDRIAWVFMALLENAIRIVPQGGGKYIQLSSYLDGSELDPDGQYLYIVVEDDGPGVAPEFIKKIFNPKVSDPQYNKNGTSTGLGLFFSRLFVEGFGGQIWVENKQNRGAMFIMRFPLPNLPNQS